MSEEEKFVRSEVGHNANDFHRHGGQEAHEEDSTEREDLENAIEALNDSEETENLKEIANDINGDFDTDIEEIKTNDEAQAEPVEEPVAAPVEEPTQPVEEPANDWKKKEENKPYMTIDEVREPKEKKKTGAGWKVATFLFFILAAAGIGATAFLYFNNGKIQFAGRTIETYKSDEKPKTSNNNADDGQAANNADDGQAANKADSRYIYLDGFNMAIKVPDTLENVSYKYTRYDSANDATLAVNASIKNNSNSSTVPNYVKETKDFTVGSLGTISIEDTENKTEASAPDFVFKTKSGKYVYYWHPQDYNYFVKENESAAAEGAMKAIQEWLTNKDNYIEF